MQMRETVRPARVSRDIITTKLHAGIFSSKFSINHPSFKQMSPWRPHWLLAGVPCVLLLATVNPQLADRLQLTETARCGAVFLIYLTSGVRVQFSDLMAAWNNKRTIFFVQGCGFVLIPALVKCITLIFGAFNANDEVLKGVMTAACIPPAVTTGVVLVRTAHADEATAVVNAALGSLLAVVMTPLLMLCTCGSTTLEPLTRMSLQPLVTAVLPFVLGRLLADHLCIFVCRYSWSAEAMLLVLLYGSCCDSLLETQGELHASHVLLTVLLVLSNVCLSAALCRRLAAALLSPEDAAVGVICASQRSLTFAMPRLHVLYSAYSGGPLLTLPLLVHRPAQLLLGIAIAVRLASPRSQTLPG